MYLLSLTNYNPLVTSIHHCKNGNSSQYVTPLFFCFSCSRELNWGGFELRRRVGSHCFLLSLLMPKFSFIRMPNMQHEGDNSKGQSGIQLKRKLLCSWPYVIPRNSLQPSAHWGHLLLTKLDLNFLLTHSIPSSNGIKTLFS